MTRFALRAACGVAVAVLFAATAAAAAPPLQNPDPIRFCLAADNLPFSRVHPQGGIEVDLAERIAARLGRTAEFHWADVSEDVEQQVLNGRCHAAFGAVEDPISLADGRLLPGAALTVPYYASGYLLIRHPEAPPVRALSEVRSRIAVEMESVPIYTLKQRGHRVFALDDYDAVIRAVATRRVDYGYVWGPLGAWLLRERTDVLPVQGFQPDDVWNFTLLLREADEELRAQLNSALGELVRSGEVERIFVGHGIPYLPPR